MTFDDNPAAIAQAKTLVRGYGQALDASLAHAAPPAFGGWLGPGHFWRGVHPFEGGTGPDAQWEAFWGPLARAMTAPRRRLDVFFAGRNEIDGWRSVWVAAMGHVMGLFDAPWLGIPPTGKVAMLRFAEFHRVEDGHIAETATFVDIPHLMIQAGIDPFPTATAAHMIQPGPATHDGLLFEAQDPAGGQATLGAINAMIRDLGTWQLGLPIEEELRRTWHEDMVWWGPAGIGTTYTIPRYATQHAGVFRSAFTGRSQTNHVARLAEGRFGGFFGWPNFTATLRGSFMGLEGAGEPGPFRVVDIYRREGDKLAENWVFIDLLGFWRSQGIDVLDRALGRWRADAAPGAAPAAAGGQPTFARGSTRSMSAGA